MEITVYTMQGCRFCDELKNYLNSNKINYTEKNISINESYKNEFLARQGEAVPLTIINNQQEFLGFNDKVKEALR
jgi:glutaredoxin